MDSGIVLTVIGLVLSVIALPVTYFLGRRTRQLPVVYSVSDFAVLMSPRDRLAADDLDLTLGGRTISTISRTYIAVWNARGDTIRNTDILQTDPLRIIVGEGDDILRSRIISTSRTQCGASLQESLLDSRTLEVNFDFLDPKDGMVIEVLHHGEAAAKLVGTLRGATIKDRGEAPLNPRVLEVASTGSAWAMYFHRSGSHGRRFPRLRAVTPPAVQLLLLGYLFFVFFRWIFVEAEVVPYRDFAMDTLEGQQLFLAAAEDAGVHSASYTFLLPVMMLSVVAMVGFYVHFLYSRFQTKFPATIAKVSLLPQEGAQPDAANVASSAVNAAEGGQD